MRVDNIEIAAYLGVASLTLAPASTVTLIAGGNAAGKSSLAEAVRHALLGRATRVGRKADYKLLLTHGNKNGQVKVTWAHGETGGVAGFKLPKGDAIKGANLPQLEGLDIALGATPFMALPDKDRRGVLMRATGVQAKPGAVGERLTKRGVTATVAEEIKPMLRSGFDAGRQYAEQQAKAKEQEWRRTTGEQYGREKAEEWEATAPANPSDAEIDAANEAFNAARADLQDAIDAQIEARDERMRAADQRYSEAQKKRNGTDYEITACPSCGAELIEDDAGLHERSQYPEQEQSSDNLEAAVNAALEEYRQASQERTKLGVSRQDTEDDGEVAEDVDRLGVSVGTLNSYRQALQKLNELRRARQAATEADAITERAAALHKAAKAYRVAEAALKPDGIPTDLITEAIRPINERLSWSCQYTGWPLVQVDSDCAVTVGGHPYGLASESERWRADVLVAEALAHATGLRCFMYDRLDVLSPQNRNPLVAWLDAIARDYDSIVVLGTFKQPPNDTALPDSVTAYWIEDGALSEESRKAA